MGDQGRQPRGTKFGGGSKRRFEEGRGNNRFGGESGCNFREEEDLRRELNNREGYTRGRGGQNQGGFWHGREEEMENKRRAMDRGRGYQQDAARSRFGQGQGNPQVSVHDRIGNTNWDNQTREAGQRAGQEANRGKLKDAGVCFWCRQEGHHQAECTNPPFCFRCKESGHLGANCPKSKGCSMHMYGYGFPDQGFYCLKVPGQKKQSISEHVGLLHIISGEANVSKVEEELKHMIDNSWQWNVRRIADKEYLASFPNKQILDVFSRTTEVKLPLYNITATISPSSIDPASSSALQEGWVKITNIPNNARSVEAITLIAELAGDVITVDELSLIRDGPVRVKLSARDISKIRGFIEIFVNGAGYEIKFSPEAQGKSGPKDPPPPPHRRTDEDSEEGDEEELDESEWERLGHKGARRKKSHQANKDNGGSQETSGSKKAQTPTDKCWHSLA
ncbi:unnamed protein product [Urochloa humidicola]